MMKRWPTCPWINKKKTKTKFIGKGDYVGLVLCVCAHARVCGYKVCDNKQGKKALHLCILSNKRFDTKVTLLHGMAYIALYIYLKICANPTRSPYFFEIYLQVFV